MFKFLWNAVLFLFQALFIGAWTVVKFTWMSLYRMVQLIVRVVRFSLEAAMAFILWTGILFSMFTVFLYSEGYFETKELFLTKDLPAFNTKLSGKEELSPILRMTYNGRFVCTATVISNEYALTAAHCVTNYQNLEKGVYTNQLVSGEYVMKSEDDRFIDITASAAAAYASQDVALLRGNFERVRKMPIDLNPLGILGHAGPFVTCGFPGGSSLVCTPFSPERGQSFLIAGPGFLYKGMSGGPVIDRRTGQIVGVNSGVFDGGYIGIGPVVGILEVFDITNEK